MTLLTPLPYSNGGFASAGGMGTDTGPAFLLFYDTVNGPATVYTVAVTSTTIVFVGTGDSSLPDDGTTTAGTLTFSVSTVGTCGGFADVVNASDHWKCVLQGCLRGDEPDDALVVSAASAPHDSPVAIVFDVSDEDRQVWCIGPETDTKFSSGFGRVSSRNVKYNPQPSTEGHFSRSETQARVTTLRAFGGNAGGTGAPTLIVYSGNQNSAETILLSITLANDALVTRSQTELGGGIVSAPGERIIVILTQASPDVLGLVVTGDYGPVGAYSD